VAACETRAKKFIPSGVLIELSFLSGSKNAGCAAFNKILNKLLQGLQKEKVRSLPANKIIFRLKTQTLLAIFV
jgi:hypothetical protein